MGLKLVQFPKGGIFQARKFHYLVTILSVCKYLCLETANKTVFCLFVSFNKGKTVITKAFCKKYLSQKKEKSLV